MAGLVAADGDAAEALDSLLQLLGYLLEEESPEDGGGRLVMDPSLDGHRCSEETRTLVEHLWATLMNWTMRTDPSTRDRLFASLSQLMRFCQHYLPPAQFASLASHPWNYLVLLDAVASRSTEAIQLASAFVQHSEPHLKSCGR